MYVIDTVSSTSGSSQGRVGEGGGGAGRTKPVLIAIELEAYGQVCTRATGDGLRSFKAVR